MYNKEGDDMNTSRTQQLLQVAKTNTSIINMQINRKNITTGKS